MSLLNNDDGLFDYPGEKTNHSRAPSDDTQAECVEVKFCRPMPLKGPRATTKPRTDSPCGGSVNLLLQESSDDESLINLQVMPPFPNQEDEEDECEEEIDEGDPKVLAVPTATITVPSLGESNKENNAPVILTNNDKNKRWPPIFTFIQPESSVQGCPDGSTEGCG
jgi:hypothetical protein